MAPSDRPRHHYSVFPVTSQRSHDSPTTITSNINSSSTSDGSGGSGSNGDGNGNGNGDDNNTSRSPLNMVEEPPPPQPLIAAPHIRSVYSMQDTLDSLYDEWVTIDIVFRSLQGAFPARLPPAEREEEYLDEIDRELSITYDDLMAQARTVHVWITLCDGGCTTWFSPSRQFYASSLKLQRERGTHRTITNITKKVGGGSTYAGTLQGDQSCEKDILQKKSLTRTTIAKSGKLCLAQKLGFRPRLQA
ncbi:hypothetical protein BX666DRAFT_1877849 [Dichotomocladium elegans]|nr:hypothetical protein BX666DRAFT_1877849 [Dichotomocladium elegans]